jgi:folate-binding protein YgfZ
MTNANAFATPARLPFLGVLRFAGPDAAAFLQGQVTHDTRLLDDGRTLWTACNTPQGRVVGLPRLRQHCDEVLALLPAELVTPLAERLKRFVLRAKVRLEPAPDLFAVAQASQPAGRILDESTDGAAVTFDYAPGRRVTLMSRKACADLVDSGADAAAVENAWWDADIADGLPQVLAATAEAFVPQMLNLDLLDAISFTKGCYTGQEIVARTQHLGRIKRRTFRYRLPPGPQPPPMTGLHRDGVKVAEVLMSAERDDGVELLAVTNLDARDLALTLEDGRIAAPVALPYAVPT